MFKSFRFHGSDNETKQKWLTITDLFLAEIEQL